MAALFLHSVLPLACRRPGWSQDPSALRTRRTWKSSKTSLQRATQVSPVSQHCKGGGALLILVKLCILPVNSSTSGDTWLNSPMFIFTDFHFVKTFFWCNILIIPVPIITCSEHNVIFNEYKKRQQCNVNNTFLNNTVKLKILYNKIYK